MQKMRHKLRLLPLPLKRGRVTELGVHLRQGRPRRYRRAISGRVALACEYGVGARCRCRCRGRLHGRALDAGQLLTLPDSDPHHTATDAALRVAVAWLRREFTDTLSPDFFRRHFKQIKLVKED